MKTQSADTSLEAEHVLVELIRKAPVSKRFKLVQSMTQSTFLANIYAWRKNHPEASEKDAGVHFVSMSYGSQLAQCAQANLDACETWHLQPVDLLTVIWGIAHIFDAFSIPWYLGGSLASSLSGMQQLAQDIDLVVDLPSLHLPALIPLLKEHYIFDEYTLQKAQEQQTSFSLLHRDSLMKVDVIQTNRLVFDAPLIHYVRTQTLDERYPGIGVASAYEMILFKLYRYSQDLVTRHDGMANDAEWNDIMGMLKVQGSLLDLSFLERWSQRLGLREIWRLVLVDSGLRTV
jgi:hypothetical protein